MPEWRRRTAEEDPFDVGRREREREQDVDDDEDDEAWALELLKDDDDLNVQFKKVTPKVPPAPPAPDSPAAPAQQAPEPAPAKPIVAAPPAPEPSPVDSHIEHEPVEPYVPEPLSRAPERSTPLENIEAADAQDSQDAAQEEDAYDEEPAPEIAPPAPEPAKRKPIRPKLEPKSTPLKDVIASLEPEPLEVDWQEPGAWRRRLLWPLLALVALLCLLAQVAWLEFDRLSRIEPYRSVYAFACRYVGCQLPELLDRSQIHTSNLLVRSHPDVADALQVDVILQNNAPFEQSFPVLELTFTNLRSEPVATRQLKPEEYLGGELAGREKMPVRQPIHIALEIADPGKDAVSYHITIVE